MHLPSILTPVLHTYTNDVGSNNYFALSSRSFSSKIRDLGCALERGLNYENGIDLRVFRTMFRAPSGGCDLLHTRYDSSIECL